MRDLWIWLLVAAVAGFLAAYFLLQQPKGESPKPTPTSAFLDEPAKGAEDAPVTIIEFADFKCHFCLRHFTQTLPLLEAEYIEIGKVRYVYRNFPILGIQSRWAALASECAHEQGRFWDYHDKLFQLEAKGEGNFRRSNLKALAYEMGLDSEQFDQCLDSYKYLDEVQQDLDAGRAEGVDGTPAFLINEQLLVGAQAIEKFREVIEKELAKRK